MLATSEMDDPKITPEHEEIKTSEDLHEYKTNEGYIIDAGDEAYGDLKVARDVSEYHAVVSRSLRFLSLFQAHLTDHTDE